VTHEAGPEAALPGRLTIRIASRSSTGPAL